MTKTEQIEMLANQHLYILVEKKAVQAKINDCIVDDCFVVCPSIYDELKQKYEFLNGQESMLNLTVSILKLNAKKYYELVADNEMRLQRQAL